MPHNGVWISTTGATAIAQDYKANTTISYYTRGKVTQRNYGMTVCVKRSSGVILPEAIASSSTVGQLKTAVFFTNTAAGGISHYHELTSVLIAK